MTATIPTYAWQVTSSTRHAGYALEHAVDSGGKPPCGVPAPTGWREPTGKTRRCERCQVGADPDLFTHAEIVDATGLTYRQMDHAIRRGYLVPSMPATGSGSQRVFSRDELEVAQRMAALVHGGMEPGPAARVARAPRAECCGGYVLGPNVHVVFHREDA